MMWSVRNSDKVGTKTSICYIENQYWIFSTTWDLDFFFGSWLISSKGWIDFILHNFPYKIGCNFKWTPHLLASRPKKNSKCFSLRHRYGLKINGAVPLFVIEQLPNNYYRNFSTVNGTPYKGKSLTASRVNCPWRIWGVKMRISKSIWLLIYKWFRKGMSFVLHLKNVFSLDTSHSATDLPPFII